MLYSVNPSKYEPYLITVQKFWIVRFLVIVAALVIIFYFTYYRLYHISVWVLLIIIVVLTGAYFVGQRKWTEELRKFKDAKYELTSGVVTMHRGMETPRQIKLSDIAVFDKTKKGTLIVIGNRWTKFNYYRPKRSGEAIDAHDRIFIPSVTSGYQELIKQIRNAC